MKNKILEKTSYDIDNLVKEILQENYTSISSIEEIPTGNFYQTIKLGDEILFGFRKSRKDLFENFDFTDKVVIDLGSNLGENGRLAARRNAKFVYQLEYDEIFSKVSSLINIRNNHSNVFSINADISVYNFLDLKPDVLIIFSVWPYIRNRIPEICKSNVDLILLETHHISDQSQLNNYIKNFNEFFPYYSILGKTDWGENHDGNRYIIAFSKSMPIYKNVNFKNIKEIFNKNIDTNISKKFNFFDNDYWDKFFSGLNEYKKIEHVRKDNSYYIKLIDLLCAGVNDINFLKELINPEALIEIIKRRFNDYISIEKNKAYYVDPLLIYINNKNEVLLTDELNFNDINLVKLIENNFDGYHRIYACHLNNISNVRVSYRVK